VETNDGQWLRLTDESCVLHCEFNQGVVPSQQAWAMCYNKHTRLALLQRNDTGDDAATSASQCIVVNDNDMYTVVDGSQLQVHCAPAQAAAVVECVALHDTLHVDGWMHNSEGVWVRLAKSHTFCLAQSATGRVYLERKVSPQQQLSGSETSSVDGKGRPTAQVAPLLRQSALRPVVATLPSVADACRAAFAAFVWHERLLKDVMACAAYLRYHPELSQSQDGGVQQTPTALQPLVRLWTEVDGAVKTSVDQHIILPSPPMAIRVATNKNARQVDRVGHDWSIRAHIPSRRQHRKKCANCASNCSPCLYQRICVRRILDVAGMRMDMDTTALAGVYAGAV
jgi:hypothetical protein